MTEYIIKNIAGLSVFSIFIFAIINILMSTDEYWDLGA